jgi:2-oxoglutarate ferredoxin oxidoreductase subunit gamma
MKKEIRITGFGGQGVMLAGYIIGKAASIFDKRNATFVQSYGPEARGSACTAQVIISDDKINYPYMRKQEVLVAMSQEGYDKYIDACDGDSIVLADKSLIEFEKKPDVAAFKTIPATQLAEKLGRRMVANIIMLGFFVAQTGLVTPEAMKEALLTAVPAGTAGLNTSAYETGLNYKE